MNLSSHRVVRGRQEIHLTKTEGLVLEVLLRNREHVVQRQELLRAVWGLDAVVDDNNLDVTMSALRSKADNGGGRRLIRTVRGFGYKIAKTPTSDGANYRDPPSLKCR